MDDGKNEESYSCIFFISLILFNTSLSVNAHSFEPDFYKMFDEHGSIMLLIDSTTGEIEYPNKDTKHITNGI